MKRALLASILGMMACSAYPQAQTSFLFNTYLALPGYAPVTWGVGPHAGQPVADFAGVYADILWSYGSTTGDADLAIALSTVGTYGPGWICGPAVDLGADYVSDTPITFTIELWQGGTGYGLGNSCNDSSTWVETGFIAGTQDNTFACFQWNFVLPVGASPEPSTFALGVVGVCSLLILRRSQRLD